MAGARFVYPNAFSVAANGVPRVGAKLYFYETGTNSLQDTFNDPDLDPSHANTNPIIADALGQFGEVWLLLSPQYKVRLFDATDNEIWTMSNVGPQIEISGSVVVGAMTAYAGLTAPTGWLLCYGQAISRTTYAELFAVTGTRYGIGNGSTTFNIPDKRGRVSAGRDDMGGAAANRLTAGVSGVDGLTVGSSGGDQRTQLHNHTLTDPGHTHTDSGHTHGTVNPANQPSAVNGSNNTLVLATGGTTASGAADIQTNTTGITIANSQSGAAQNVQPTEVDSWLIFANA